MNLHARPPIVIGGSGRSGTRVFAEVLARNGVFMGIPRFSKGLESQDVTLMDLLNRWVPPYLASVLSPADRETMRRQFKRRLRFFFPLRLIRWGFKSPRSLLLLPFFHELFPHMKFIHVVRDGRDMAFGWDLNRVHVPSFLSEDESALSPHGKLMLFWGRSNLAGMRYGTDHLKANYLLARFEDLCTDPQREIERILRFCDLPLNKLARTEAIVARPSSIGRWRKFDPAQVRETIDLGREYLHEFGYL